MVGALVVFEIHHKGRFVHLPHKLYLKGSVDFVRNVDSNLMSYFEMLDIMKDLGIPENHTMYHKLPDCDLDGGLREIKDDKDVVDMFAIHKGRAMISLYSESPESIVEIGDGPDGDPIVEIGDEDPIVEISDEGGSESEGNETTYTQSLDDSDYEMFANGIEFNDDVVETENVQGSKDGLSQ
ncbi:hypothetical protein RHGRI_001034 [Rhododendron griersonianum]|uniref:PB1-like domain-containing protein n=1 Tax=Rhododendron griersonianum TaxID=479676 RepID=A0AAV6LJX8_9ERIC|nr:hypothetical protein RHGRI_001034 [Rhododendron griersonianum]